jgi:hypothetical protein|tara:strand:- start:130 stop:462 length:333 start_codon:yes stop_codon:yes gene_type:complete
MTQETVQAYNYTVTQPTTTVASVSTITTAPITIDTGCITTGTPYPITGAGANSIWIDEFQESNITIGKQVLNEEKIEKLTALLDILEGLEGSELSAMLETQILLNKVRND